MELGHEQRNRTWAVRIAYMACLIVVGIAGLALAGWFLEVPWMNRFGSVDIIPMAPSTAILLVLQAGVLFLGTFKPNHSRTNTVRLILVSITALVALAVLVLTSLGIKLPIEHYGFFTHEDLAGISIGHMSPVTAGCFLLAVIAELRVERTTPIRLGLGMIEFLAASLLLGTATIFSLAYLYGSPLLYGSDFIPPALNTSLAFALLGLALLIPFLRWQMGPEDFTHGLRYPWFFLSYMLLAVGMLTAGYFHYKGHEKQHLIEVERELLTIAEWKVSEIVQFRKERLGDGKVFLADKNFALAVERFLTAPDQREVRHRLLTQLHRVRDAYEFEQVFLLDRYGQPVALDPQETQPVSTELSLAGKRSLNSQQVVFQDFYRERGGEQPIRLAIVVPIVALGGESLGVLVLRIDPTNYFYPALRRWPIPIRSGETLMVRKEGDRVLFLNDLLFSNNAALSLSLPLTAKHVPAVQAALGYEGIVRGMDYRGVRTLAAVQAVPNSPWFLVVRMDLSEVYAPLTERLWQMVFLEFVLLIAVGIGFWMVWRQQTMHFYRAHYEAAEILRERENELRQRNDELTRFTYTVSHDLKSPLVTIQTFLGYLEQDMAKGDSVGVEKDVGFIRGAASKMSRLLDDLLELSRVGRKMNPAVEVSLLELVGEAQTLVAGRIAERQVKVEVTQEPVFLHGDRLRLLEVFQNLLDNAAKFMGTQPSPTIVIGIEPGEKEPVLFVKDNGMGIDPRHLPRLFGLFEKLDNRSEGTGIGLALVRRIIEIHGGRIWVESEGPLRGACFRFTLAGTRLGHTT